MGSEAFDRDQLRLAWGLIGSVILWILYESYVIFTVPVPGTSTPFGVATGNTLVLIREHTTYTTRLGFVYGERPLMMWFFTILPFALAAWWLYRGHRDEWQFLHE